MYIQELETHLSNQHRIAQKKKELEFDNFKEFCEWKEEEVCYVVCSKVCPSSTPRS